jgi:predicted acetyltransferase
VDFEIVVAGPDDFPAVIWPDLNGFGMVGLGEDQLAEYRTNFDDCRLVGAQEGGEWVGTLGRYPFDLTVPGGATLPVAGLTWASVLPTHRRRGILRALMAEALDAAAAGGLPAAVLLASEASIYQRFGFGVATRYESFRFDPRHADLLDPPGLGGDRAEDRGSGAGRLRLVAEPEVAVALAGEVWERYRRTRPGLTTRRPWMWEHLRGDPEYDRDGYSGWVWAFHFDDNGAADGYAHYRMKEEEQHGQPAGRLWVRELVSPSATVEAVLFDFVCGIDLVRTVDLPFRPVDDHLPWRLRNRRELVVAETGDFLWLRVLDVVATLTARHYGAVDELVLEVDDPFRPATAGRYLLRTGPREPECERLTDPSAAPGGYESLTRSSVDVRLDVSALSSLVLGTTTPSVLAAAGRFHAAPDVIARADACFGTGRAPFANTEF